MQAVNPTWSDIFGVDGLNAGFQFLYLPGAVFLVAVVASYAIHRMTAQEIRASWVTAGKQILRTCLRGHAAVPSI